MSWREFNDQPAQWDFLRSSPLYSGLFLQTPAWANFLAIGAKVKVLGWWQNDILHGLALLVRCQLPGGWNYWLCSKGPVWSRQMDEVKKTEALYQLYDELRTAKVIFLRLEPPQNPPQARRTIDYNPRATSVVDLKLSREDIFARMHEKTRYNIRLAERKGLVFRWGKGDDFDNFLLLLQETARRDGFRIHTAAHYQSILKLWDKEPLTTPEVASRLGLVEYKGQLLAASMIIVFNHQATYLHGASSRIYRELMAPHLLHGAALLDLKNSGVESYDLWGIQPTDGSLSAWTGFSRFKVGFGGRKLEAPGTFDHPLRPRSYFLYHGLRSLRRGLG